MANEVTICRLALQAVGARTTIESLEEDSNEAIQCRILFGQTRDELLRKAWWNFARRTVLLTLLKSAPGTAEFTGTATNTWSSVYPPPPWLYSYALPEDCVKARYIIPQQVANGTTTPLFSGQNFQGTWLVNGAPIKFVLGTDVNDVGEHTKVLLTNQSQAILVYTARVENTDLWDAQFTAAFVALLAAYLANPISGDRALRNDLMSIAVAKILEAATSDGNEGLTVQETMPELLLARGAGDDRMSPLGSIS